MSRLLLVRHGPSAHVHDGSWIDAADAQRFEVLYDAASIQADASPPATLIDVARSAQVILTRSRTPEMRRAGLAAEWVDGQAAKNGVTVAVTHGGFRRLLSAKLAQRGWRISPGRRRYHNWSVWELTRPAR